MERPGLNKYKENIKIAKKVSTLLSMKGKEKIYGFMDYYDISTNNAALKKNECH